MGRGIYKWVAVIDFSKFYPNAIKSSNAGIETSIDIDNSVAEGFSSQPELYECSLKRREERR